MSDLHKKNISPYYGNESINDENKSTQITGIFSSIKSGIIGFVVFFLLLLGAKILSYSTSGNFTIGLNDIVISFWGFLIVSFSVFVGINKNS